MPRTFFLLTRVFLVSAWIPMGCCPPLQLDFACSDLDLDFGPECAVDDDCEFSCRSNGSCTDCVEDSHCGEGAKCNGRFECVPLDCTDFGCEAPAVCRDATRECEIIDCVDINDPVCTGKNFLCATDQRCAAPDDVTGCGGPPQRSPAGPLLTSVTFAPTNAPECDGTGITLKWTATSDRPTVDITGPPWILASFERENGPTPEEESGTALMCDDGRDDGGDDVLEVVLHDQDGLRSNAFCIAVSN